MDEFRVEKSEEDEEFYKEENERGYFENRENEYRENEDGSYETNNVFHTVDVNDHQTEIEKQIEKEKEDFIKSRMKEVEKDNKNTSQNGFDYGPFGKNTEKNKNFPFFDRYLSKYSCIYHSINSECKPGLPKFIAYIGKKI
jgi:hypothetical protein